MQSNSMPQFGGQGPTPEKNFGTPVYSGDPFAQKVPAFSSNFSQKPAQKQADITPQPTAIAESDSEVIETPSSIPSFSSSVAPSSAQSSPQPFSEASQIKPESPVKNNKKFTTNQTLVFLSVILGVITLISTTVAIWALVNRPHSATYTTSSTSSNSTSSSSTDSATQTLGFFPKKIVNPTSDVIYRLGVHNTNSENKSVIGAYINTENTAVEVYVYWEYVNAFYGIDSGRSDRELFTVEFDKKICDIALAESGQSKSGDVILVLLSDGTVHYIPVFSSLQAHNFTTSGQLNGVANVVKFYKTDAVSNTGDFSGYSTTLAQRADGTIIDLQAFLISATNQTNSNT